MNRDRSYYHKQRLRVIHCKENILRQLGGEENAFAWEHGAVGRLSKGNPLSRKNASRPGLADTCRPWSGSVLTPYQTAGSSGTPGISKNKNAKE